MSEENICEMCGCNSAMCYECQTCSDCARDLHEEKDARIAELEGETQKYATRICQLEKELAEKTEILQRIKLFAGCVKARGER